MILVVLLIIILVVIIVVIMLYVLVLVLTLSLINLRVDFLRVSLCLRAANLRVIVFVILVIFSFI